LFDALIIHCFGCIVAKRYFSCLCRLFLGTFTNIICQVHTKIFKTKQTYVEDIGFNMREFVKKKLE
jgi:hypothetical protein